MFDVGFTELVLLFVIGLLILGPERLPRVASQIGRWVGRARRTANQLRYQLEREVALEEMNRRKPKQRDEGRNAATSEPGPAAADGSGTTPQGGGSGDDEGGGAADATVSDSGASGAAAPGEEPRPGPAGAERTDESSSA